MKKIIFVIFSLMVLNSFSIIFHADASSNDFAEYETVSLPDVIVYTAMQEGQNWTGYQLVDFGVKHGSVANNDINQFSTFKKDDDWQASLGNVGDDAYCEKSWKIYTLNNDGFIFEFVAKENISVSIIKSEVGQDWVDSTNLNVYKKSSSDISTIKSVVLSNNSKVEDYNVEVDLAKGETLYWEFIFPWDGSHRNMINLPTATFTYIEDYESSEPSTPVIPDEPEVLSENVSFSDMIIYTAMQQGENWTEYKYADFGVKFGNVANGSINKFTTYKKDEGWSASLGSPEDNAYAETHWKIFTLNNEGLIFEFVAKDSIKVTIEKNIVGGDWTNGININVYKKTNSTTNVIKTVTLTGENPISDYNVEVELSSGDILYYEIIFPYDGSHRNMINMPNVTFTYVTPHAHDFTGDWVSDDTNHWHECYCGEFDEKVPHSGGSATEEEEAKCEVCNSSYGDLLNHEHIYSDEWTYDETQHWHQSTCGHADVKKELSKHELTWNTIKEATLFEDGEKIGVCICGYEESEVLLAILADYPDYSVLNEIELNDLAIGVAANNGEPVVLDSMEINLVQGNVFASIRKFDNYEINLGEKVSVLISDTDQFDGEESSAFSTWRIKTTSNSAAIFEIKATADIKLTISHEAFNEGWIDMYGQYFGLYVKSNDRVYTQWTKDITTNIAEANQYGGSIMLKAGDVCYYVFGSNMATQRNVNIAPIFTASKDEYNEDVRNNQMILDVETVNMWDALTATINNNYNDVEYNVITFGFYYGNVKELIKFDYHVGDGTGTEADALWESVALNTGFKRWQLQCSIGKNAIMKITAKEDIKLYIAQPITEDGSAAFKVEWATFTSIRYYVIDVDGTRVLLENIPVTAGMSADYFNITLNLAKGQTLFIDYHTENDEWGSLDFRPIVTASTKDFDENNVIDFSVVRALDGLKTEKIDALEEFYDGLDEFDYSINNWGKIENYILEALTAIEEAQTESEILKLYDDVLSNVDAVKTSNEEKVELDAYKKVKIDELSNLVSTLNEKNYTKENWTLIINKLNDVTEKINKAKNKTSVDTLLANAKTYINKVPKIETGILSGCGAGCKGSITPTIFALITIMSILVVLKKEKIKN